MAANQKQPDIQSLQHIIFTHGLFFPFVELLAEIPAGGAAVITQGEMIDGGDKEEPTLTKKHYVVTTNPLLNTTEKPEIPGGGYYSDTTEIKT